MSRSSSDGPAAPLLAGSHRPAILRFAIVALLLLGADLFIKYEAFQHVAGEPFTIVRDDLGRMEAIPPHPIRTVVPKVLGLHLTVNHGAVFGLGQGRRWIFVGFSVIAGVVIPWIFARSLRRDWIHHMALAAVLGGAFGNLYDRIFHGGVRDMFLLFPGVHLPFGWKWPGGNPELYPWIFNFADVCLVVGLGWIMVRIYRGERVDADADESETGAPSRPATPSA
ncbi:MAG: signal peptidase II [Phycisphaerales bacterium]